MDARLERKLRLLAGVVVVGVVSGIAFNLAQGRSSPSSMVTGLAYGLSICLVIWGIELFALGGPMRVWLSGLSFALVLLIRSAIYAAIFAIILALQLGEVIAGLPLEKSGNAFWSAFVYSALLSVVMNLVFAIANIIGPRAFLNFVSGRYHTPVEEKRFGLFVDVAGSTGLAERLGGVGIHRFLDRMFRLLALAVVDYRGEINYVGDEVIVTWRAGRAVRCAASWRCAMRWRAHRAV